MVHAAYRVFWGPPSETVAANPGIKEAPATMLIVMIVLAALCILLGVWPQLVHPLLNSATSCTLRLLGLPTG
ncbi:MAG: hypothetical protein FJX75_26280 [Armatimonadetes bacterium]|nr:hypothetical protein [Armatimonadota bacterium]